MRTTAIAPAISKHDVEEVCVPLCGHQPHIYAHTVEKQTSSVTFQVVETQLKRDPVGTDSCRELNESICYMRCASRKNASGEACQQNTC